MKIYQEGDEFWNTMWSLEAKPNEKIVACLVELNDGGDLSEYQFSSMEKAKLFVRHIEQKAILVIGDIKKVENRT